VIGWPVETQLGSRRNALVASTALTQLRREREEVEDFLATCTTRRTASGASARTLPASHTRGVELRRDVI